MRIVTDGKALLEKSVLALGMFDGLHIGHRVLLERARVLAKRSHVPLVVCTFTEHPLTLIAPEKCPPSLTTLEEKASLMEKLGVDLLYAQPFTEEMRQMPPEVYVGELIRRFHPVDVVCGYNHTFGKDGSGTSAFLAALGDALGFHTHVVPQVTLEGQEVSSSRIRQALAQGKASEAAQLLGRPYEIRVEACQEEGLVRLKQENGKQWLAQGSYRCLFQEERQANHRPCVAKVLPDGKAMLNSWLIKPGTKGTLTVLGQHTR